MRIVMAAPASRSPELQAVSLVHDVKDLQATACDRGNAELRFGGLPFEASGWLVWFGGTSRWRTSREMARRMEMPGRRTMHEVEQGHVEG